MGDSQANGAAIAGNDDDRKIFIGGLAQLTTENDLKEYFGKFGTVTAVTLKMDPVTGRSRGFAFVVFEDVDALQQTLVAEHVIKEKKVAVKKAASKQGKIYVGKFTGNITEDEIKSHFMQYGNVVEIQRPVDRSKNSEPKNFCFITFDKEESANQLLSKGTVNVAGQDVEIKKVTVKTDGGMGGGGGRGGMRGGMRGGGQGGWGGGQGGWDQSWGYGGGNWGYEAPPGPWPQYGGGYGGGGGQGGWGAGGGGGGWGDGGYGGGGKMGGQGGYRGRGGRGGRSAPY